MLRLLVFLTVSFGVVFSAQAKERELMVLVLIDALRPDHMGAYGYSEPTTPELDKLAALSTRYTRAYANAPDEAINGQLFNGAQCIPASH